MKSGSFSMSEGPALISLICKVNKVGQKVETCWDRARRYWHCHQHAGWLTPDPVQDGRKSLYFFGILFFFTLHDQAIRILNNKFACPLAIIVLPQVEERMTITFCAKELDLVISWKITQKKQKRERWQVSRFSETDRAFKCTRITKEKIAQEKVAKMDKNIRMRENFAARSAFTRQFFPLPSVFLICCFPGKSRRRNPRLCDWKCTQNAKSPPFHAAGEKWKHFREIRKLQRTWNETSRPFQYIFESCDVRAKTRTQFW